MQSNKIMYLLQILCDFRIINSKTWINNTFNKYKSRFIIYDLCSVYVFCFLGVLFKFFGQSFNIHRNLYPAELQAVCPPSFSLHSSPKRTDFRSDWDDNECSGVFTQKSNVLSPFYSRS